MAVPEFESFASRTRTTALFAVRYGLILFSRERGRHRALIRAHNGQRRRASGSAGRRLLSFGRKAMLLMLLPVVLVVLVVLLMAALI